MLAGLGNWTLVMLAVLQHVCGKEGGGGGCVSNWTGSNRGTHWACLFQVSAAPIKSTTHSLMSARCKTPLSSFRAPSFTPLLWRWPGLCGVMKEMIFSPVHSYLTATTLHSHGFSITVTRKTTVLFQYNASGRRIQVNTPLDSWPLSQEGNIQVSMDRRCKLRVGFWFSFGALWCKPWCHRPSILAC